MKIKNECINQTNSNFFLFCTIKVKTNMRHCSFSFMLSLHFYLVCDTRTLALSDNNNASTQNQVVLHLHDSEILKNSRHPPSGIIRRMKCILVNNVLSGIEFNDG